MLKPESDDEEWAEYARRLFGVTDEDDAPASEERTTPSNYVPKEGINPTGKDEIRAYVDELFDRAHRD